jgi:hypothetical protein
METPCPQCGSPSKGKFCGVCGCKLSPPPSPVYNAAAAGNCPECAMELPVDAKFCGGCGYKVATTASPRVSENLDPKEKGRAPTETEGGTANAEGVVSWSFLQGEVARKISSEEIVEVAKGGAKGFIVDEGQRALIYVDGSLAADIGPGKHQFLDAQEVRKLEAAYSRRTGGLVGALEDVGVCVGRFFLGSSHKEKETRAQNTYEGLRQKLGQARDIRVVMVRSAPFLTQHVLRDVVTKDLTVDVAISLRVTLGEVKEVYSALLADRQIVRQSEVEAMLFAGEDGRLGHLAEFVGALSGYTMAEISRSEEVRRALSIRLQELSPAFLRVLQLTSISAKRDDLERVRTERESNFVAELELENLVATNRLCNRFQLEGNRRALEEARNSEEFASALQAVNFDKLIREEQAAVLLREIEERSEDHQLNRSQALRMVQFQQDFDYQKARLQYEEEITSRQFAIQRQREADEAAHRLKLEKERADFEHDEDMRDLDVLGKMQAVKDQQAQREHERALQVSAQAENSKLEMIKQFAGMTAEQILVANPDLSPHQAAAMAEMAKAKAEVAQKDDRVDIMREMQQQQQAMFGQFMQSMGGALAQASQSKDAELKRALESNEKSEERMTRLVSTTVGAMKGVAASEKPDSAVQGNRPDKKVLRKCSHCGAGMDPNLKFCQECGEIS